MILHSYIDDLVGSLFIYFGVFILLTTSSRDYKLKKIKILIIEKDKAFMSVWKCSDKAPYFENSNELKIKASYASRKKKNGERGLWLKRDGQWGQCSKMMRKCQCWCWNISHVSLIRSGDPAWDLPDPKEHAPFCLVCQLYLFWKDPLLKYDTWCLFMQVCSLSKPVSLEAVTGFDVIHDRAFDFF